MKIYKQKSALSDSKEWATLTGLPEVPWKCERNNKKYSYSSLFKLLKDQFLMSIKNANS